MTSNTLAETGEKSREDGMDSRISNPLEISTVYATLSGILTRQKISP